MVRYPRVVLRVPHAGTDLLPPWPLTRLSLLVTIRTSQQSIEEDPDLQIPLSIAALLKPRFRGVPTDGIHAALLSFEALLEMVESESSIKFDPARDEFGYVEDTLQPGTDKHFRKIFNEFTFHNAVGISQLLTTQSKPPQEIILHLWSPAPKESNVGKSYQWPDSQPSANGEKPEAQVSSSQLSSSSPQLVIDASLNRLVEDVSSDLLKASATEQSQSNAHSSGQLNLQRTILNSSRSSGLGLHVDGLITDKAQDQMPGAWWGDW